MKDARISAPVEAALVAAILAALLGLLAFQAWNVGVTIDEPSHLLSSYLYWGGSDRLPPRDMPPLMKAVGGWVPRLFGLPVPAGLGTPGDKRTEWDVSYVMMAQMTADQIRRVFFFTRLTMAVFPLLTALLIWWWGRRLFGQWVAILLMALFALEPTALAHGALFKNDLAATFGYLLFWFSAWNYWEKPDHARAALFGVATLLAMLSKMSMLTLVAFAAFIVVLQYWRHEQLRPLHRLLVPLALVLAIPYLGCVAAYQFDAARLTEREVFDLSRNPNIPDACVVLSQFARVIPIPRGMWEGAVSLVNFDASSIAVYLFGQMHSGGSALYFPLALAVKMPVPLQILLTAGLVLAGAGLALRRLPTTSLFWILPGFLYIAMASFYPFQLGVRLVLPALPFGLFACGLAIQWLWNGRRRIVLAAFGLWLGVASAAAYPYGISYFNLWVGGAGHGLDYLTDSNIDWGQGLPELSRYIAQNRVRHINVAYFGTNALSSWTPLDVAFPMPTPFQPSRITPAPIVPQPGLYAISASMLTGHLFTPAYRNYFKNFRSMQPAAKLANSIYIYKVEDSASRTTTSGGEAGFVKTAGVPIEFSKTANSRGVGVRVPDGRAGAVR